MQYYFLPKIFCTTQWPNSGRFHSSLSSLCKSYFFKLANYRIFIRNKIFPPFPFLPKNQLPNIPTPIYLTNLHVQFPYKAISILLKWWCHGQHGRFLANRHRQFVANGTIGHNGVLILRTFSLPPLITLATSHHKRVSCFPPSTSHPPSPQKLKLNKNCFKLMGTLSIHTKSIVRQAINTIIKQWN